MAIVYSLLNGALIGPSIRRRVDVIVTGRENLPVTGAFILAMGSHTTEVESLVVAATLRERQLHFYAKSDYWSRPGLKGWAQRHFMDAVGNIPMERGEGRAALKAIEAGVEVLRRGQVLAVYPEGTRISDGKVHAAYPGTVRTLLDAVQAGLEETGEAPGIPIIPVGLVGMGSISAPEGGFVPLRGEVEINIGAPMYLSPMEIRTLKNGGRPGKAVITQEMTPRMMRRIARLCGKEYDPKRAKIPPKGF